MNHDIPLPGTPKGTDDALWPPRVFILGGGNVGLGMAIAFEARSIPLAGLWNRGVTRAAVAAEHVACPVTSGPVPMDFTGVDLVLLTVSDRAIPSVGASLAGARFDSTAVLAHTSGCMPAVSLPQTGVYRGSMHPLLACPTPEVASRDLPHAFYAVEGDEEAVEVLSRFVGTLGGQSKVIEASVKARYHAAGVMASNCIIALLKLAALEAEEAGLEGLDGPLIQIALGAVQKAAALGISASLTGPALRGDANTVRDHMQALSPLVREAYRPLTQVALAIAEERGLPPAMASEIADAIGAAAPTTRGTVRVSSSNSLGGPGLECTQG